MIQLYAKLSDLTPTESKEQVESIVEYWEWEESIKLFGIKKQLHITHEGKILDGNGRYHAGIKHKIKHAPIDIQCFTGIQNNGDFTINICQEFISSTEKKSYREVKPVFTKPKSLLENEHYLTFELK